MTAIHKATIPVDDAEHEIPTSRIVHVQSQSLDSVTIWYYDQPHARTTVRVIGTGQQIPDGYEHQATTLAHPFVWHLMRKTR